MMEPTPLRPDDQVAGGFLVLRLGGQDFEVKDLPMDASREWMATAQKAAVDMKGTAEGLESFEDVVQFIVGQGDVLMDLVLAYDALGKKRLPERAWVDSHATVRECWAAWKQVTDAAAPFVAEAFRLFPDIVPVLIETFRQAVTKGTAAAVIAMNWSNTTSGSPPSTDGPPITSTPTSPTPSSTSTSRKPRSARRSKPS